MNVATFSFYNFCFLYIIYVINFHNVFFTCYLCLFFLRLSEAARSSTYLIQLFLHMCSEAYDYANLFVKHVNHAAFILMCCVHLMSDVEFMK